MGDIGYLQIKIRELSEEIDLLKKRIDDLVDLEKRLQLEKEKNKQEIIDTTAKIIKNAVAESFDNYYEVSISNVFRQHLNDFSETSKLASLSFKYQLIEKWDGKTPLIISDSVLYTGVN